MAELELEQFDQQEGAPLGILSRLQRKGDLLLIVAMARFSFKSDLARKFQLRRPEGITGGQQLTGQEECGSK